jgi:DNA-binding winged helix-turn-helix (wHTH) protein/tetratricopeptide (TPR) repeat protein
MIENEQQHIEFAEFVFETGGNLLMRGGAVVSLEPSAARVLRYFLESDGRLVSKEELLETVWRDVFTTEDVLKRAVSQIRRALGDDAQNPRFIETHHRRGYRFITAPKSNQQSKSVNLKAQNSVKFYEKNPDGDPNFDCFVGREREIIFLQTEFRRVQNGAGQPILLVGEPGIGKTQTAARFTGWASATHNTVPLRVRFFDYEASYLPPYDLFLDLLGEACAKVFEIDAEIVLKNESLFELVEKQLNVRLPGDLLTNSLEIRQSADASRIIAPLAECFARLSRKRPLVLIFDDIQWADETSRKIIGFLMRIASDAPLMVVGLARRAETENTPHALAEWLQKQAVYRSFTTLELAPLSTENCREVIGQVFSGRLDTQTIPLAELEKLQRATGGNPYFLVETVRLLINENVIEKVWTDDDFKWFWRGIEDAPLPETIRIAARAKLNNLSDETRDLIEFAAVLGDAFQINTLELMRRGDDGTAEKLFDENLDEAIRAQILTERNVSGADDCQFYHTTLRRAVYADLSPRRRKRLHFRAFSAIAEAHKNELERFAAALAAHAENADDFAKSLHWNIAACRAAAARYDWAEAAELVNRAERVTEKSEGKIELSTAEKLNFLALRGEVYLSTGRRSEAEKILAEAQTLAEADETTDAKDAAIILLNLGRARILLGKYREARPVLEKCLALAESGGDNFIASSALIQLASEKYALCEYEASCRILQKIIDAEPLESYNRAVALGKLGWARALQSRFAEAKILLAEAFAFHQTAGDLRERAVLSMCLNWCEYGTGDYEAAIESALRARREAKIIGEPYNETVALMRVSKARIAQGLYQEAEKILLDVWEKQKNLDAPHAQAETVWMLGRARIFLKNYESAEENLKAALVMIRAVGDRDDEFRILIDQAQLANAREKYADALRLSAEAADIAQSIEISEGIGEALICKTWALTKTGEIEKAVAAAREAVRLLEICNAGERWQALHALAAALDSKRNSIESDAKRKKSSASNAALTAEIETSLRRALNILDEMRGQFSAEDELRRRQFTISLNAPARELHDFFVSNERLPEALEINQTWLFD